METNDCLNLRRLRLCATTIAVTMLALNAPIAGAAKPNCNKDPSHASCGGDDGGQEVIPLKTTFHCPATNCTAPRGSTWQADNPNPYVEGQDNVKSRFNSVGHYVLTMHEKQNTPGTRKVEWDVTVASPDPGVTLPNNSPFTDTGSLPNGYEHKTVIKAGSWTGVDLRTLDPLEAVPVDLQIGLLFFAPRKRDNGELSVRYDDPSVASTEERCPGLDGMGIVNGTVTRTDMNESPRTWTITIPDQAMACIYDSYDGLPIDVVSDYGELTIYLEEDLN